MAGPGSNLTGQRSYDTLINGESKKTKKPYQPQTGAPLLEPTSYGAYAAQIMGLQTRLASAMALQKAGIGAAGSERMMAMQGARAGLIDDTAAAEQNALQRGIVGSSSDLSNRAAAVTTAAGLKQSARAAYGTQVAQIRAGTIGAIGDYYTGLGSAQADLANQQAMLATQRYLQGLYDQGVNPGKGNGRVRGDDPRGYAGTQTPTDTSVGGNSFVPPTPIPTDTSVGGNSYRKTLKKLLGLQGTAYAPPLGVPANILGKGHI